MEEIIAAIILLIAFFVTIDLTKSWIRAAKRRGITGPDMNKLGKPMIVEAGGITVILGFCFAILVYIFFKTFYLGTESHLVFIFALLATVLLAGFLGFIDDILKLKQVSKVLLTLPIAIPLVVINAGTSVMNLPLLGPVDLGLFYPLLIVPIGIIGAANGFNLLAGFNGLEAGMGAVILATLGFIAWATGLVWLALIAGLAVSALLAFLVFNIYEAKIFPGDSLTYAVGALIACVAILGNMEKIAVFLFIPYIAEFFLKARSRFRAQCFGLPQNGYLKPKYKKIYSLTHLIMRGQFTEPKVTGILILTEVLICFAAFWLFL